MDLILEIIAVFLSLTFLILLIGLYAEAILYIYYVIIGIYGYSLWNHKNESKELLINDISPEKHVNYIIIGVFSFLCLGYFLTTFSEANHPYLDAFTTIFSFIASYMEAKKILSGWYYWIMVNGITLGLYLNKELLPLYLYFILTLLYFAISFYGLREWKRKIVLSN